MRAHRFNTATLGWRRCVHLLIRQPVERMKGFMNLQPRSMRRGLSNSIPSDPSPLASSASRSSWSVASLLCDASGEMLTPGLPFKSNNRLAWLFGDTLSEELAPSAAKRPAKKEEEDDEEEDEDEEDGEDEEEEEIEEEEEEDEEDEEEEDEEEEEEEDEFDDPDTGFDDDDDDDDDEEDFDDDE